MVFRFQIRAKQQCMCAVFFQKRNNLQELEDVLDCEAKSEGSLDEGGRQGKTLKWKIKTNES